MANIQTFVDALFKAIERIPKIAKSNDLIRDQHE